MKKALLATVWVLWIPSISAQVDTFRVDTAWKTVIMTTPQAEPIVDTVVVEPDVWPQFPGGDGALYRYVAGAMRYPEAAVDNGIQGKVVVEFIVEKDGSVGDAKVKDGGDSALDKEALRVIRSMPRWSPGTVDGKPVRVKYVLPIRFALE